MINHFLRNLEEKKIMYVLRYTDYERIEKY